jgi:hypothetical protein
MIPKSGHRFPACAKPRQPLAVSFDASAGEARSEKIMLKQQAKTKCRINQKSFRFSGYEPAYNAIINMKAIR